MVASWTAWRSRLHLPSTSAAQFLLPSTAAPTGPKVSILLRRLHIFSQISHLHISVTAFEITGTGHITQRNHTHLQALHIFCKPCIKLGNFKKNISGLSIYSSYHIWPCRSDPLFQEHPFLQSGSLTDFGALSPSLHLMCFFSCCDQSLVKPCHCPRSECKLGKLVFLVVTMGPQFILLQIFLRAKLAHCNHHFEFRPQ